jgi:hypothetical protein
MSREKHIQGYRGANVCKREAIHVKQTSGFGRQSPDAGKFPVSTPNGPMRPAASKPVGDAVPSYKFSLKPITE